MGEKHGEDSTAENGNDFLSSEFSVFMKRPIKMENDLHSISQSVLRYRRTRALTMAPKSLLKVSRLVDPGFQSPRTQMIKPTEINFPETGEARPKPGTGRQHPLERARGDMFSNQTLFPKLHEKSLDFF